MAKEKARDITGAHWSILDGDGDEVIVYTPRVGFVGLSTVKRGAAFGHAATLDRPRLERLIAELSDRLARMPA